MRHAHFMFDNIQRPATELYLSNKIWFIRRKLKFHTEKEILRMADGFM